jgi:hypothetical protein
LVAVTCPRDDKDHRRLFVERDTVQRFYETAVGVEKPRGTAWGPSTSAARQYQLFDAATFPFDHVQRIHVTHREDTTWVPGRSSRRPALKVRLWVAPASGPIARK